MREEKNRNVGNTLIVIIVTVVITLMAVAIGYLLFIRNNGNKTPNTNNQPVNNTPNDKTNNDNKTKSNISTFKYVEDNYGLASFGYAIVKGYAEVDYKSFNCGTIGTCDGVVSFYVTSTDSSDFKKAMSKWGYDDEKIPLGCLKNGLISYISASDEFGPIKYEGEEENAYLYYLKTMSLTNDVTKKIIASDINNQITLKLGKSKLTHYMNLYDECRTIMTSVEIVN